MGAFFAKGIESTIYWYNCMHVTYYKQTGNIIVVHGYNRDPEDCIQRRRQARFEIAPCCKHAVCILQEDTLIRSAGTVALCYPEAMLRMESGSKIDVGVNAQLMISDMLLMEKDSTIVVEPGAIVDLGRAMHIPEGTCVCFAAGKHFSHFKNNRINASSSRLENEKRLHQSYTTESVTWCDDDRRFLIELICLFRRKCGKDDHTLPFILPIICQRYGMLMAPFPYGMPTVSEQRPTIHYF